MGAVAPQARPCPLFLGAAAPKNPAKIGIKHRPKANYEVATEFKQVGDQAALRAKIKLEMHFPPEPSRNRPESPDCLRKMAPPDPTGGQEPSKTKTGLKYNWVYIFN